MHDWLFDQTPDTAAITTKQVLEDGFPILSVAHYLDDHSWGFFCGTTNNTDDGRVVGMGEMVNIDSSLNNIADLPPGWKACRDCAGSDWRRQKNEME